MATIRNEFQVHILDEDGIARAKQLAEQFSMLLNDVEKLVNEVGGPSGTGDREMRIVREKLQEASFFAKRALALRVEHKCLNAELQRSLDSSNASRKDIP